MFLYLRGREYQTRPDNFFCKTSGPPRIFTNKRLRSTRPLLSPMARLSGRDKAKFITGLSRRSNQQKAHAEAIEISTLAAKLGRRPCRAGLYLYYEEADYEGAFT